MSEPGATVFDAEHCTRTKYAHLEATHFFFYPSSGLNLGGNGSGSIIFFEEVAHALGNFFKKDNVSRPIVPRFRPPLG